MGKQAAEEPHQRVERHIERKKMPAAPVPGLFCMDMVPNTDTRLHDASLDGDYKIIHTPFLDFFPVDVLSEMRAIAEPTTESWLRHDEQIDSRYYREQSDRRDCIKRDEAKNYIEDVRDYQRHVEETFAAIDQKLPGYDVLAEYDLFPDVGSNTVLGTGEVGGGGSFVVGEGGQSTLIDRCLVGGQAYECMKQSSTDNIVIEIRDGRAYYFIIPCVYKFKKINK